MTPAFPLLSFFYRVRRRAVAPSIGRPTGSGSTSGSFSLA
jgi:hypothetical protein